MKKYFKIYSCCILLSLISLGACNSTQKDAKGSENNLSTIVDTMKLNLDFASIDTTTIIFTENEKRVELTGAEKSKLESLLSQCVNDTAWNNSGIMVKMVAPDYMLDIHYLGKARDNNSWMSIWIELGKAKVGNKWYLLPEAKDELFDLLNSYK